MMTPDRDGAPRLKRVTGRQTSRRRRDVEGALSIWLADLRERAAPAANSAMDVEGDDTNRGGAADAAPAATAATAAAPAAGAGAAAAATRNAGELELEMPFVEKYRPVFVSHAAATDGAPRAAGASRRSLRLRLSLT